ncbi:MAG: indole-3-glycerol phosphate synthase TrpC [Spirochaetaceae bacterium]|nr:indole-3-glycerol phosphate synthase TrpC [Spirochaetaceae bacterium]
MDKIAAATRRRVAARKAFRSEAETEEAAYSRAGGSSGQFESAISVPDLSFICELKRASPSKGMISTDFPYIEIAQEYEKAGAAAVSVLTEPDFFMGSDDYLRDVAKTVSIPALRKDFTVDAYQIYEAKLLGAAAVLLIAALLDEKTLASFIETARKLGMSALVEAHDERQIEAALRGGARIVGVNNRDLGTFSVDLGLSLRLRSRVPDNVLFVAESGITGADDVKALSEAGVDAALIGEAVMRAPDRTAFLRTLRRHNAH